MLRVLFALLVALSAAPAAAESHDTDVTLYREGDFRISAPGTPTQSNFYALDGYRPIDPTCYSGTLTLATNAGIPIGGGARFYANERIALAPGGAHVHSWTISSDPISLAGLTAVSSGAGSGAARVQLLLNRDNGLYRLVTDVTPRMGLYQITTTGTVSRSTTEEFFFGFGDHHYSYVDLSGLEAASGHPEVAAALVGIRSLLSNRPPNVFIGRIGRISDVVALDDEEVLDFAFGVRGQVRRQISVRITCTDTLRD